MNVEIAERLATRRKEAGLSQEVLAERLGVSRQAVSKWERSESSPDTDNLIALAKLYGVSLDDLLYVDDLIEDDIKFEAADRAAGRRSGVVGAGVAARIADEGGATSSERTAAVFGDPREAGTQTPPYPSATMGQVPADQNAAPHWSQPSVQDATPNWSQPSAQDSPTEASPTNGTSPKGSWKNTESVHVGFDGIHVKDGSDYVHVSWRDGIHVREGEEGDEVHVSWGGIHVNDPDYAGRSEDYWVRGRADDKDEVAWTSDGVTINGEHFDNWHEAKGKYGHEAWRYPNRYTVNGEDFDTLEQARAKYGDKVGTTYPVRKHYQYSAWLKFPYPLVAIIAYLSVGFTMGAWGMGLFILFTIPLYYMIGHALVSKRIAPLLSGAYPLISVAWFLYMGFVLNAWHPAWVVFLTIPVAEWLIHSISSSWRRRKKVATVIDVEGE